MQPVLSIAEHKPLLIISILYFGLGPLESNWRFSIQRVGGCPLLLKAFCLARHSMILLVHFSLDMLAICVVQFHFRRYSTASAFLMDLFIWDSIL